jgi:hypothetical protein
VRCVKRGKILTGGSLLDRSGHLLEHTRRIVQAVAHDIGRAAEEILAVLAEALDGVAVLLDQEDRVALRSGPLQAPLEPGTPLPEAATQALRELTEPARNLRVPDLAELLPPSVLYVPLRTLERRVGTLIVARAEPFKDEEEALAEWAGAVLGLVLLHAAERPPEAEDRYEAVRSALAALSYSELEAVRHILRELGEAEGIVVASRVADRAGITRSVIVNALRKLESARVIQSRSLGMKGTYIKILNPLLREELERLRSGG